ncbi:uncharacterized protein C8Q71DRAFT_790130 [Rhodofomes roseus]|uniref:DRBM domain-containing protein n=1 Tax=Rhodofomes roseus TaxID=34475 RepID=A0ABQ8JYQ4_9APHY|nr:uncharacterized protein C8Q71DRAFT_790130 [Rhodofomes roseus]KAH9829430.1 hypothetical protein C8Q71DRAFT_790130 [Rhodofomes roseus]
METDGHRMRLNNLLQSRKTLQLTWQTTQSGLAHQPTWQAIAYINGAEHGRGTAQTQGQAKELAARETYNKLVSQSR